MPCIGTAIQYTSIDFFNASLISIPYHLAITQVLSMNIEVSSFMKKTYTDVFLIY